MLIRVLGILLGFAALCVEPCDETLPLREAEVLSRKTFGQKLPLESSVDLVVQEGRPLGWFDLLKVCQAQIAGRWAQKEPPILDAALFCRVTLTLIKRKNTRIIFKAKRFVETDLPKIL